MKNKVIFKYLSVICIAFILTPFLIKDTGSGMFTLLILLPTIIAITSLMYGYKEQKIDYLYSILVGLLFLPVILTLNDSAFYYSIEFIVIAFIFNVIGKFIKKKK